VDKKVGNQMLLQPKNWAHFQHYKDRCPPWIKLHRDLLNNRDFMRLPIASKALAPMLWLLASESKDGQFDGSLDELVFRLHITPKEYEDGLKPLLDKGFFITDDNMLATRLQDAIPETKRETETKKEKKVANALVVLPDWIPLETWEAYLVMRKKIKKPPTEYAIKLIIDKLEKFKANGQDVKKVLEKSITAGWQDVFEIHDKTFGNKFDVAHTTTPPPPNQDAALKKIAEDRKKAVPMPADIKAKMAELTKGMKV
jgi:hypothetical protein